jgi:biotin carboxyl carrier protein
MSQSIFWSSVCLVLSLGATPVFAGPGHDHGDEAPVASSDGPKRQADGSVFLPKPTQRQIGLLTLPVVSSDQPQSFELNGKVVMDPNASGTVQAMIAGRVTPGPNGIPLPGQRVNKGDVLVYVTPEVGGNSRSLAESRLNRLRELSDTVPRRVIEEAEAAVANEHMRAPVSGVIASSSVVSGQVVQAGQTLFEVVDPERLLIEALAYDLTLANDVSGANIAVADQKVPLNLLGVARSLRDQALPLTFSGQGAALTHLAIGQPLKVVVQTRKQVQGFALPAAALAKNPANQTIVWVKTAPEIFEPRPVIVEPLNGQQVVVVSGLQPNDRVAIQGANLINQIR